MTNNSLNLLAYTFSTHTALFTMPTATESAEEPAVVRFFALIDAAQLTSLKQPLQRHIPDVPSVLLFEENQTQAALALSPVLYALSDEVEVRTRQMLALDAICRHLPIMSILRSSLTLHELMQHLRSLLLIEADETAYMLRFADSQMLLAINAVLTPCQRAYFFKGLQAWFTVDYQGQLHDAADSNTYEQSLPASHAPLKLNAAQTYALMDAVIIPVLASQVRALDKTFAQQLNHAQQTAFIDQCITAAQEAWIPDDELTTFTLQRWQTQHDD